MPRAQIIEHRCEADGYCDCKHRITLADAELRVSNNLAEWIGERAVRLNRPKNRLHARLLRQRDVDAALDGSERAILWIQDCEEARQKL